MRMSILKKGVFVLNKKIFSAVISIVLAALVLFTVGCGKDNEENTTALTTQSENTEVLIKNGVVTGTDGWLFYNATMGDYTGEKAVSDRKAYNAAHNIALMQEFVKSKNADFVFAAAPNKNSVYSDNMPTGIVKNRENSNISRIFTILRNENVNFVDLFSLFEATEELLYLKTDSHWNNKGALLAYNAILDSVQKEHNDYSDAVVTVEARECGDLEKAINEEAPQPEENYYFDINESYTYKNKAESVEAPLILTENPLASGSLLMFRDSFGNSLLPFFADNFGNACFSKGVPYILEKFMKIYTPDTVVVEVAERNVTDYAVAPPVFSGLQRGNISSFTENDGITGTINLKNSSNDMDFLQIYGTIYGDEKFTEVFVDVNGSVYEAFTVSDTEGDFSYLLYLPKALFTEAQADAAVYIVSENETVKAVEQILLTEDS